MSLFKELWPRGSAVLLILFSLAGCRGESSSTEHAQTQPPTRVTVAAAANLKFAFDEIKADFETAHPDVQLEVTYGSSGNFFAQLSQRAPFDIFFSADTKYPRRLLDERLAAEDSYFRYASGRIAVWVPNDSKLDLETLGIRAVVDPSVQKVAIANPRLAPYGAAAEQALKEAGVYDEAKDRLVLGENVTQAAHFIETGAADVGIIALSLALAPQMKERGRYWEVPSDKHRPIEQGAVITSWCRNREAAQQLRGFILGPKGREILSKFGYSPPEE